MINFIIGNLIIIVILQLICIHILFKYCYDGRADIWRNEKAEKIYYKLAPLNIILLSIEVILVTIWVINLNKG